MRLFISFAEADKAFVNAMLTPLNEGGHNVDQAFDKGGKRSKEWMQRIGNNEIFLAVLSEPALSAYSCRAEWEYALTQNVRVVVMRIADVDTPKLLQPMLTIKAQDMDAPTAAAEVNTLLKIMEKEAEQEMEKTATTELIAELDDLELDAVLGLSEVIDQPVDEAFVKKFLDAAKTTKKRGKGKIVKINQEIDLPDWVKEAAPEDVKSEIKPAKSKPKPEKKPKAEKPKSATKKKKDSK